MKNIIFLFCLMFSGFAYSQSNVYDVYKTQTANWDEYKKEWQYDNSIYTKIQITVNGKNIYFTDKANSRYTVYDDDGESNGKTNSGIPYKSHTWKCYDESNRKVYFKITIYDNSTDLVITVMYDNILFRYYVSRSYLDRLN